MEVPYIDRKPLEQNSMDFAYLRRQAMEYLQQHAADSWTDHNAHDPGITMLEVLCYAITDLGNRLKLPIADIIASQPQLDANRLNINFPQAARILPNNPLSIIDFRRALTDLAEVRKAYVVPAAEPERRVFYDATSNSLTSSPTTEEVEMNGLFNIQIEWEEQDGEDLNSVQFLTEVEVNGTTFEVVVVFPYWDEVLLLWLNAEIEMVSASLEESVVTLQETDFDDYYAEFTVTFSNAESTTDFPVRWRIDPTIEPGDTGLNNPMRQALSDMITGTIADVDGLLPLFKDRLGIIGQQLERVRGHFLAQRNLSEDIVAFKAIRLQDIGLDLALELSAGSNPVEVIARVLLAVEGYFSPQVVYESLQDQLLTKSPDQIFSGPLLTQGFLPANDFAAIQRRDTIYVSDLVALMLEEEGVFAVRKLLLSNYINNFPLVTEEANCLDITASDQFIPRLSLRQSNLVLYRNGQRILVNPAFLRNVRAEMERLQSELAATPDSGMLERPLGEQIDLKQFLSIQHDFPDSYTVGEAQLSTDAPVQQQAQARQLQAFLLLFDQILADHNQLIVHFFDYFSIDTSNSSQLYPNQVYYDAPGIKKLLLAFQNGAWSDFVQDKNNAWNQLHASATMAVAESGGTEQPLDYLLARYADDFSGFDNLLVDLETPMAKAISEKVKRRYLQAFPELAAARCTAFNYGWLDSDGVPKVWDVDNVSGAERIICHKMGWPTCTRRQLHNDPMGFFQFYDEADDDGIVERRFRFRDITTGDILLSSSMSYESDIDAGQEIEEIIRFGRYLTNYEILQAVNDTYYFRLFNPKGEVIAWRIQPFTTAEEALAEAERVSTFIYAALSHEGLHVLEHLLLRPKFVGDELLNVLQYNGNALRNPYAQVITLVVPSGNERDFSVDGSEAVPSPINLRWLEPAFMNFLKKTVREEMPASILVNVVPLDINIAEDEPDTPSLQNFERQYRRWLEIRFDPITEEGAKVDAQNTLVAVINNMYNG